RLDRDVEVLVFGPTGGTDDKTDPRASDSEPREESLTKLLALGSIDRHKHRCRTVVQNSCPGHAKTALEKRRQPAGDAQVAVGAPRITALEPAREANRRMPASQTQLQQRVTEIVPVDDEPHTAS